MSFNENQFKDHIIDQIIKLIISNRHEPYFYNTNFQLDILDYKKTITDSGYIQTTGDVDGNKKHVIYQEDYQTSNTNVDTFIQQHLDCFQEKNQNGSPKLDQFGQYVYYEPQVDWVDNDNIGDGGVWSFRPASFSTWPCQECETMYCDNSEGLECDEDGDCPETGTCTVPSTDNCLPSCTDDYGNSIYGRIQTNDTAYIQAEFTCPNSSGGQTFVLDIVTPACDTYSPQTGTPVLNYLSQLVQLGNDSSLINPDKANEVLDTTIFELLPGIQTRQERINKFFSEYAALKPPQTPDFDTDGINGIDWADWDVGNNDGPSSDEWYNTYDISSDLNATNGYITRLVRHQNNLNTDQSLEWLRNNLNAYLTDVDTPVDPDLVDERIDYTDVAEGYLKFRGLNQSIIVRPELNDTLGLEDYQTDGFTIAMWVRFIDKKSNGTLFNYGNPFRTNNPYGFVLETFTLGEDDDQGNGVPYGSDGNYSSLFTDTSHARFVRLVVRGGDGNLYNSHVGSPTIDRVNFTPEAFNTTMGTDGTTPTDLEVITYTPIPTNRNEWYFIVANFNASPGFVEPDETGMVCNNDIHCSVDGQDLKNDPNYWRQNVNPDSSGVATYTNFSNQGARCKVEIISKSDLLRARGYKT